MPEHGWDGSGQLLIQFKLVSFPFSAARSNVDDGSQARFEATARGSRLGTLAYRRVAYLIHIFNGLHYFVVANMRAERDLISAFCRSIIGLILRTISLVRLSRGVSFSVLILLDKGSSLLLVSGSGHTTPNGATSRSPTRQFPRPKLGLWNDIVTMQWMTVPGAFATSACLTRNR